MDTTSGRIYLPDEFSERKQRRIDDEHQAEFEARLAAGKIVEVSDQVAERMLASEAFEAARKSARKSAKQARKRNR